MSKSIIKIIIGLLLICLPEISFSQSETAEGSSKGYEFWLAFMPNREEYFECCGTIRYTETLIYITADEETTVIVRIPQLGFSFDEQGNTYTVDHEITISANSSVEVNIPYEYSITYPVGDVGGTAYASEMENDPRGIQVVSLDKPVSVYTLNSIYRSADAALIYPITSLGSEHYIITSGYDDPTSIKGATSAYQFLVLSTQDNTEIHIIPSGETIGGTLAGQEITVTLDAGEVYQVQSVEDLSGTLVDASDCIPIAVFAGNSFTGIPSPYENDDVIYEQILATNFYGKKYIAVPFETREVDDTYKILALDDNTEVQIFYDNTSKTLQLDKGESSLQMIPINSNEGYYIESNNSIMLAHFSNSCNYDNVDDSDPFMDIVPSIEQYINNITFNVFEGTSISNYYINIVTASDNINDIFLDGNSIAANFANTTIAGNEAYSFARFSITTGNHTLESTEGTFLANIYGYEEKESYGYIAGAAAIDLSQQMYINEELSNELTINTYCMNSDIDFKAVVDYSYENIYWNFGDGTGDTGEQVSHAYDSAGTYQVDMIVKSNTGSTECYVQEYDTISIELYILEEEYSTIQDTICEGENYTDNGFTVLSVEQDTTVSANYVSAYGCDSIVTLQLTVQETPYSLTCDTICEGENYEFNGNVYDLSGTYISTIPMSSGCDSLASLQLEVISVYDTTIYASICEGSSYSFNGTEYSGAGEYTILLTSSRGCDSTVTLSLTVNEATSSELTKTVCDSYTLNGETYLQSGTYTQMLQNAHGCDSTITLNLEINSSSEYTIDASICEEESYIFNNTTYTKEGIYKINLTNSVGCDSIITINLTEIPNKNTVIDTSVCKGDNYIFDGKIYTESGSYTASYSSSNGCDSIVTLQLTVNDYSPTIVGDTELCEGDSTETLFYVSNAVEGANLIWYVDDSVQNTLENMTSAGFLFSEPGIYELQVYQSDSLCSDSDTLQVLVSENPYADFTFSVDNCSLFASFYNQTEQVVISDDNSSEEYVTENSFRWIFGDNDDTIYQSQESVSFAIGRQYLHNMYPVTLYVSNSFGCTDSVTQIIDVGITPRLYVASAFAPINQAEGVRTFIPKGLHMKTYEIRIFDKWGNLIWYSDKLSPCGSPAEGWTGIYDGELLQTGSYIWKIEVEFLNGGRKSLFGNVLLIR